MGEYLNIPDQVERFKDPALSFGIFPEEVHKIRENLSSSAIINAKIFPDDSFVIVIYV